MYHNMYYISNKIDLHNYMFCYLIDAWVTHKCVSKLTIIGSNNGLSPGWHQAIIWTKAVILLNWPLGTNFNDIL